MPPRARHRTSLDPLDLYVLAPFQGLTITRELQPNGLHPYEFKNVTGGDYYIFASYNTEYSYIDWLVPVSVANPESTKIDLYNGSARCIKNKNDD